MHPTRWTALALLVPAIAAIGIACDRTTPTEVQRPSAASASPSMHYDNDDDSDNDGGLKAVPFVFVGTAPGCAPSPPGTPIVTSAWLGGMGLPDNGDANSSANPNDPRIGLLLNKNGLTTDCSSSGARILGVRGMEVGPEFMLGFDFRNGGHCGGGAPRFNVAYKPPPGSPPDAPTFSFVGNCSLGMQTNAPQDPLQWTRVRFSLAASSPPIPPGSRIQSISILYDEGTDQSSVNTFSAELSGVGLSVIDNIYIDGKLIKRGRGIAEARVRGDDDDHDDDGMRNDEDDDDDNDGVVDTLDTDADGDGIEDALAIKVTLPRLFGLQLP